MRILMYAINHAPELTGIGKYTGEMAEWLAGQGHEVRVITAPPYYPAWQVDTAYRADRYRSEWLGRVQVTRCPLWVPTKPSGLKRLLHLASFALSSLPVLLARLFWRPQVIFVVEPPLMCAPAAWLAARLSGARCWLHVQDFEVDAAFDMGLLPAGKLRDVVLWGERILMRRFDRVSTISPNMLTRLANKGVPLERTVLFPNWVDIESVFPLPYVSPMRAALGIRDEELLALYSGNMGEKQGLEVVLEVARKLADYPAVRFVLCGDGAARPRLQAAYADLPNVRWLPLQPLEKLNDLLNAADLHLLPQRADVEDLVMPSKLTGMLASGRPVVATARQGSQIAEALLDCGVVVEPGDVESFVRVILELTEDKGRRTELGGRAREYALANLSKESVLLAFERQLGGV